ncbi:MAG: histidinol-phosphate transaminase [Rhodospirillales bacterium]|nr:histidinol-phosphate transaminase [Rhodospirillales bacterium]
MSTDGSSLIPRPGILDISPYVGGESEIEGRRDIIKLSSNEGAFGPSPKAMAAFEKASGELHRYPDGTCETLRKALGKHHGLDPVRIVCGAGSDELIGLLCRAYAGSGDEILYSQHGFLMYPIAAKACGATPVMAPETDLKADVDALLARVTKKTRILFLANPNNPTGSYLSTEEVQRLRDGLPASVLLVIDAAYAEYMTRNDYSSGAELVDSAVNTVMARTFSKVYGLGGLRLGWAYCPPDVADVLNRVRNPFNVSGPAQAAGLAALDDIAFIDRSIAHNEIWRAWLADQLRGLGLTVPDGVGNFVLARFPDEAGRDAAAADGFMKERGIIVRRVAGYGLPDCLRITVGNESEMRAVVAALKDFTG